MGPVPLVSDMDLSEITPQLYVGTTPGREDYALLHQLGIGLVVNLRIERRPVPDPHNPPIPILWLPVPDFPMLPIPVLALKKGVLAAREAMAQGRIVYAHCAEGRHRGPALAACILISQGQAPDQAMQLIKERRPTADPGVWYIRRQILRFAKSL